MRLWPSALLSAAIVSLCFACGSRTGLLVPGDGELANSDGSTGDDDSGQDMVDAGSNSTEVRDALPAIDVTVPPLDAFSDCPDAGSTLVYVVTEQFELLSFYPPTAAFTPIGTLDCPAQAPPPGEPRFTPFSMAVDHTDIAYVLYNDGELFRVSTATAECRATGFQSQQQGFSKTFGMGYSHDNTDTGET